MNTSANYGRVPVSLVALAVLASCGSAEKRAASSAPVTTRDAWARAADLGATGGAYITLVNTDTTAVTITGWSSPAAERTELHETMEHDGMAQMMPRTSVAIARDSAFVMKPGGVHVMLIQLTRALAVGDTIRVTMTLADGRTVVVPVPVRSP